MENAPGPSTPPEPTVNVPKPLNNSSVTQVFNIYSVCKWINYVVIIVQ